MSHMVRVRDIVPDAANGPPRRTHTQHMKDSAKWNDRLIESSGNE